MMQIERSYTFEAAHHLPLVPIGHKCREVHGHTYRVTITLSGPMTAMGWVVDFGDVDAIAKPLITQLDHTDLNLTIPNPTAEAIAYWLGTRLGGLPVVAVRVQETDRGAAIWMPDAF